MSVYWSANSTLHGQDQRAAAGPGRPAIEAPAVPFNEMRGQGGTTTSECMVERVLAAREIQWQLGYVNALMPAACVRVFCSLNEAGERTLELAMRKFGLSARAHDRILKVARTIADLSGQVEIQAKHVAEAVQYRGLDLRYWV